jgi:hypothetical protein
MVSPLMWKRPCQIALIVALPVGAIAGLACGYHLSEWTWGGAVMWVTRRANDVIGWATLGAVLAGMAAYGALAIARPRRRRGTADAAPEKSRSRTQSPRAENTNATTSRRWKERKGRVSLQQALQSTGNTAWRA